MQRLIVCRGFAYSILAGDCVLCYDSPMLKILMKKGAEAAECGQEAGQWGRQFQSGPRALNLYGKMTAFL